MMKDVGLFRLTSLWRARVRAEAPALPGFESELPLTHSCASGSSQCPGLMAGPSLAQEPVLGESLHCLDSSCEGQWLSAGFGSWTFQIPWERHPDRFPCSQPPTFATRSALLLQSTWYVEETECNFHFSPCKAPLPEGTCRSWGCTFHAAESPPTPGWG